MQAIGSPLSITPMQTQLPKCWVPLQMWRAAHSAIPRVSSGSFEPLQTISNNDCPNLIRGVD